MPCSSLTRHTGDEVSHYGFEDHPFSEDRIHAFWDEMHVRQLADYPLDLPALAFALEDGPAVIISDSFGRPWRIGTTNVAIGVAGCAAVIANGRRPSVLRRILRGDDVGTIVLAAGI